MWMIHFSKKRTIFFKALAVLGVLLLFGVPFHYWTVDRKGTQQTLYPLSGFLSSLTTECSEAAPEWQAEMMRLGVWSLRASASQSAFVDSQGNTHHCESGWEDGVLFSPLVSSGSLFQYGSLTKPITAALVLKLVNQGRIDFDRPVIDFFDGDLSKKNNKKLKTILVQDLLRHEAGVYGSVFKRNQSPWCPYEMDKLFTQKPWRVPSGTHRYSNLNYCILGAVASEIVGTDYRSAAYEVFDLEAHGIEFVDAPSSDGWVSPDYRYHDFYREDLQPSFDYFALSSTAGMGGSATGYAELMSDLLGTILGAHLMGGAESCDLSLIRNCYGDFFYIYKAPNDKILNVKEGYMPGFSSVLAINEKNEVFVWLGNSDTPNAKSGEKMKQFLDAFSKNFSVN